MKFIKNLTFLYLIFLSINLSGHEFSPAHLIMNEKEDSNYEATWMYPIRSIGERASLLSVSYTHLTLPTNREV